MWQRIIYSFIRFVIIIHILNLFDEIFRSHKTGWLDRSHLNLSTHWLHYSKGNYILFPIRTSGLTARVFQGHTFWALSGCMWTERAWKDANH